MKLTYSLADFIYGLTHVGAIASFGLAIFTFVIWLLNRKDKNKSAANIIFNTFMPFVMVLSIIMGGVILVCNSIDHWAMRHCEFAEQCIYDGAYVTAYKTLSRVSSIYEEAEQTMEDIYEPCCYQLAGIKRADGDYIEAIKLYAEIPNYKDATTLLQECTALLEVKSGGE